MSSFVLLLMCTLLLSLQSGNSSQPKAVFFLSNPLGSGHSLDTLRDIINASCFEEVLVFVAVCSAMHSVIEYGPANVTDDDTRAFALYRNQILEWLWLRSKVIGTLCLNLVYNFSNFVVYKLQIHYCSWPVMHSETNDKWQRCITCIDWLLRYS